MTWLQYTMAFVQTVTPVASLGLAFFIYHQGRKREESQSKNQSEKENL